LHFLNYNTNGKSAACLAAAGRRGVKPPADFTYNNRMEVKLLSLRGRFARLLLPVALLCFAAAIAAESGYRLALFLNGRFHGERGVFELYAVGDSSMRGIPFHISPPEIAGQLLGDQLAGRRLRVVNLAEGGSSIYPQALRAIRTMKSRDRRNPAAVLIYAGHAENITVEKSRNTFLLGAYAQFRRHILLHSLLFSKLVFTLERSLLFYGIRDLGHYEFYLRKTIEAVLDAGATPVLATLGCNFKIEPAIYNYRLPSAEKVIKAFGLEERGEYAKAVEQYSRLYAGAEHGEEVVLRPYLAYRSGRCLELMGKTAAALPRFIEALETEISPVRAKPSQNDIIRRLAREYAIPLVDADALFISSSPGGIPGEEFFMDPMHPNAAGSLLLSRAFAERLAGLFQGKVRSDIRDPMAIFEPPGDNLVERRSEPYIAAGACLLWTAQSSIPIPERLKLAERDFARALAASSGNFRARVGHRISVLSVNNNYIMPGEVYDWFQANRSYYEFRRPMSGVDKEAAEKFLSKWEKLAAKAAGASR